MWFFVWRWFGSTWNISQMLRHIMENVFDHLYHMFSYCKMYTSDQQCLSICWKKVGRSFGNRMKGWTTQLIFNDLRQVQIFSISTLLNPEPAYKTTTRNVAAYGPTYAPTLTRQQKTCKNETHVDLVCDFLLGMRAQTPFLNCNGSFWCLNLDTHIFYGVCEHDYFRGLLNHFQNNFGWFCGCTQNHFSFNGQFLIIHMCDCGHCWVCGLLWNGTCNILWVDSQVPTETIQNSYIQFHHSKVL